MLNDSEKERIETEEIYRQEIRSELESKKSSSGLWKFLNSAFGIFLLSSVLLGGISFSYKEWRNAADKEEKQEQKKEHDSQIRNRLRAEAIVRLNTIYKLKDGAKEYESLNVLLAYWGNSVKADTSLIFQYYHLSALFSTYKEWTIFEVLAELRVYEKSALQKSVDDLLLSLREHSNQLGRGINLKDRTRSGRFLDKGRYNSRTRQYKNREEVIQLKPQDLPLTRYYYAPANLKQLLIEVGDLLRLLEAAK